LYASENRDQGKGSVHTNTNPGFAVQPVHSIVSKLSQIFNF